jgi:hypothetical protein
MRANSLLYKMGIRKRHQHLSAQQRKQFYSDDNTIELIGVIGEMVEDYYIQAKKSAIREIKAITDELRSIEEERKLL